MSSKLTIGALAALAIGCADISEQERFAGYLTIWNRNSVSPDEPTFYEILELYVHEPDSGHGDSLIDTPLAIDATLAVPFVTRQVVTVVRRRNTGQNIALTTGEPLEIDDSCHVLEVFDELFRFTQNGNVALAALVAAGVPDPSCSLNRNDGGADDGGPTDGGDAGGDPAPGD